MFRQTTFGIALSMLVLGSGLTTIPVPGHTSTKKTTAGQATDSISRLAVKSTNFHAKTIEKSVFEQINRYRISKGLPKLTLNAKVSRQARFHSQNMALGKVPFSHQEFERRVSLIPIAYNSAAENVAYNIGYEDPASEAVTGWVKSQGHLKNIKGNFNLTGIGVAINDRKQVYLTQIFLRTRKAQRK
ncbi:MAG: CAP domain-containing protein [Calothrix sp. MO_167.B42]|nr:CAP domain-containing protein [Calothrix sp. MO_167.B42]